MLADPSVVRIKRGTGVTLGSQPAFTGIEIENPEHNGNIFGCSQQDRKGK